MKSFLADMMELMTRTLGEGNRVAVDVADDLWPAMADQAQLGSALLNLASNARDAMKHGGHPPTRRATPGPI